MAIILTFTITTTTVELILIFLKPKVALPFFAFHVKTLYFF